MTEMPKPRDTSDLRATLRSPTSETIRNPSSLHALDGDITDIIMNQHPSKRSWRGSEPNLSSGDSNIEEQPYLSKESLKRLIIGDEGDTDRTTERITKTSRACELDCLIPDTPHRNAVETRLPVWASIRQSVNREITGHKEFATAKTNSTHLLHSGHNTLKVPKTRVHIDRGLCCQKASPLNRAHVDLLIEPSRETDLKSTTTKDKVVVGSTSFIETTVTYFVKELTLVLTSDDPNTRTMAIKTLEGLKTAMWELNCHAVRALAQMPHSRNAT
jgi:hypothetical protein